MFLRVNPPGWLLKSRMRWWDCSRSGFEDERFPLTGRGGGICLDCFIPTILSSCDWPTQTSLWKQRGRSEALSSVSYRQGATLALLQVHRLQTHHSTKTSTVRKLILGFAFDTHYNKSLYLYGLGGRMLVSVLSKIFFSLLRPPTVLAFPFLLTFSRPITCSTSTARSGME